jgi:DHA1 family tetracycline resistance protein-like MFS transporter
VPEDAQGELQGGISAITNISMLFGTVFFTLIFSHFYGEAREWRSPDVAYWFGAGFMVVTTLLFILLMGREKQNGDR